jgi:hypothetical protein
MFASLTPPLSLPTRDVRAETGGTPPRRRTGPVLMGDIHGQIGGTPLLLLLWERWEQDAANDE